VPTAGCRPVTRCGAAVRNAQALVNASEVSTGVGRCTRVLIFKSGGRSTSAVPFALILLLAAASWTALRRATT
jgi:hypothetical protein